MVEERMRFGDVHLDRLRDGFATHLHVKRFFAHARPGAFRAARIAAVPAEKHAHMQLVLLGFEEVEELAHAFDLPATLENGLLFLLGQIAERNVEAD